MQQSSACPVLTTRLWAGLGAAIVLAASLPALAGDLSSRGAGGIKDYGASGVPVPAPMPYEETYKWYIRGDVGLSVKSYGKVDQGDWLLNLSQPDAWKEQSIISFGFGRYITPNVRVEATLDYRTARNLAASSSAQTLADTQQKFISSSEVDINSFHGSRTEDVTYQNTTLMLSGFYDFNQGGRLRPYVGAGVGLAIHQLKRTGTDVYNCYDSGSFVKTLGPPVNQVDGCSTQNGLQTTYTSRSSANPIGYGLAAQLSAGVSYDLTPRTHWDTGYRALWQSGRVAVTSSDGVSTLRINDRTDHEIRTGIRWDLW